MHAPLEPRQVELRDVRTWLNRNYKAKSQEEAGLDAFGTPYETAVVDGNWVLRSCGRDRTCATRDDVLTVFGPVEPPAY